MFMTYNLTRTRPTESLVLKLSVKVHHLILETFMSALTSKCKSRLLIKELNKDHFFEHSVF